MATSIFHGITKSNLRTICRRLDAYMIIIYTSAKTPQNLTRLSPSLSFFLPFSFHFLIRCATYYRLISLPPSFPLQHNHQDHQNCRRHFCVCSCFCCFVFQIKNGGWWWRSEVDAGKFSLKLQCGWRRRCCQHLALASVAYGDITKKRLRKSNQK